MLKKLTILSLCAASAMAVHIGELNINNTDVEAELRFDMGQFNTMLDPDTTYIGVRYMRGSEEHSDDALTEDKNLLEVNYLMQRPVDAHDALTLGIGIKVDHTTAGDLDFLAASLGIEAEYRLPTAVPLYIGGAFYYSPEVLSFMDARHYVEGTAHVDIEVIERGRVTLGYRNIETEYDVSGDGDVSFNKSFYGGFKFAF